MKGRPPQNGLLQKDHIKKLKHKNEKTIKSSPLFSNIKNSKTHKQEKSEYILKFALDYLCFYNFRTVFYRNLLAGF